MINIAALGVMNSGRGEMGNNILSQADWYVHAKSYDAANDRLTDLSGNGNHARFGSAVGADTNDPTRCVFSGHKYLYCTGLLGEDFRTPDTAALDITGDIALVARIALDDLTPSTSQNIFSKLDSGTVGSYALRVLTTGAVNMNYVNGTPANVSNSSTVTLGSVGVVDGQNVWIAATLDVDNGSGSNECKFYYSIQDVENVANVTWTQLGTTITTAGVATIQASSEVLQVGAMKGSLPTAQTIGKIYFCGLYNSTTIAPGNLVCEFNLRTGIIAALHTTVTCGAYVWTRTTAATGKHFAIVDETKLILGVDDYLNIADAGILDFAAGQDFTIISVVRHHDFSDIVLYILKGDFVPTGDAWLIATFGNPIAATYDAGVQGCLLGSVAAPSDGERHLATFRRRANVDAHLFINLTVFATTTTLVNQDTTSNTSAMRIGASSDSVVFSDMEFMAAAIFREALSDDQIRQVVEAFAL